MLDTMPHVRRTLLVAGVALASFASSLAAQGGAPQSAQKPPPQSTALILGQVVDGSTGEPIAEALVTLTQMGAGRGAAPNIQLPAGAPPQAQQAMQAAMAAATAMAGRGGGPLRIMTGTDGRFVFHNLPPGNFQLTATLNGYSSSLRVSAAGGLAGIFAASMNAEASPVTLAVKEGEFATGLRMRLWKNAVVSGIVLDDAGEPAIGVAVQVARRVMAAGRARYAMASTARTDDRGAYRLSSLVPGDYLVVVPQTQVSVPTAMMSGLIESVMSVGATGSVGAMAGNSNAMAFIDAMSSGINPMDAMSGGVRMGDYMVASSGSVPLLGADGRLLAYQTVFYPGAPSPAQAAVISLKSGEDRTDVNLQLRLIPTSRISGTAMGPDGPVPNLGIRLVVPGDGSISESEIDVASAVSKTDGTFAFYGVPPGQFLLRANKQPRPEMPAELMANPALSAMFGGGGKGATDALFATTTVNVGADDLDGVILQLAPGFRVSGRLEFASQTGRTAPTGPQLQSITVTLTAMDGRSLTSLFDFAAPERTSAQGEFRTKGYAPGKYFVSVSGTGTWQMKSATIGGRDVLDAPLELREADVGGVVVTFTDRLGQISGSVRAPGETDLSDATVLMFPADHRTWVENGMNPRRSRTARPSRAGAYSIPAVPAGDYLVVAIDSATSGDPQDPAFVEVLSRLGTRVTVGTDPQVVDLSKVRVVR